ncbi:uncharacterized protein ASPGLDRAFT_82880 [Aspergillus glaucus CBS 516.65]|uniref:Uncharacterized protein n=1 Tax=Aspergillus glaucus CBS 516.65 TaxID=1160497 RepID=A0A1L9VHZ1_ASPGL|nr:hypothetical protein ASPGLDRAFT_82880 [Aspergillus glaucus CBS 516.65]OJJ83548.1 hypothetical protein ASPGLDRAFT_82880 [Aspergillus glaucus CBS 516.65]
MVGGEEITQAAVTAAPKGPRNHFANRNELRTGVQKIRQHMENYQTNPHWYNELFNFFQGVEDFAKDAQSGRENSDSALADIHKTLERIQNDTKNIREKQSIIEPPDSAACWRAFRARNWQHGVQNASTPTSQDTGTTTPGVPHTELGVDCELTVKIRDEAMRADLKKLSSIKIVERAERARESAVKKSNNSPLAVSAFIAARQLPSGDVSLRASNAVGAEVLRHHADKWVKTFGMTTHVRVPTWASVAHGVLCRSMDLTQEKMMDVATRLIAANQHTWGKEAEILHVGWLVKPRKGAGGKANKAAGQGANKEGTELLEGLAESHGISNDTDAHGTDWSEPLLISHWGQRKRMVRVQAGQPDTSTCLAGMSTFDGAKENDVEKTGGEKDIPDTGDRRAAFGAEGIGGYRRFHGPNGSALPIQCGG